MNAPPARTLDQAARWLARRDAGLGAAEGAELAAWLDADPAHRAAFAHWETQWRKLDAPHAAGRAAALAELLAARRARRRRRRFAGAAAGAAVLLAISLWRGEPVARAPLRGAPPAVATVSRPERQALPDGSVAELNGGARLRAEYSRAERRVVLEAGEAHFEVVPDAARPFLVRAGGVEVRAVGTAFSVSLARDSVAVLVTHGRVAVAAAADAGPLPLGVGERVVLGPAAQPPRAVPAPEREELLAWRAPRVEFSGATLAEAVALLNREAAGRSPVRFVIADPPIAGLRISGILRADYKEAFVRLLEQGFGVAAEERAPGEIALRRAR